MQVKKMQTSPLALDKSTIKSMQSKKNLYKRTNEGIPPRVGLHHHLHEERDERQGKDTVSGVQQAAKRPAGWLTDTAEPQVHPASDLGRNRAITFGLLFFTHCSFYFIINITLQIWHYASTCPWDEQVTTPPLAQCPLEMSTAPTIRKKKKNWFKEKGWICKKCRTTVFFFYINKYSGLQHSNSRKSHLARGLKVNHMKVKDMSLKGHNDHRAPDTFLTFYF